MMYMRFCLYVIFFILVLGKTAIAQQNITLFFAPDEPHTNLINPAVQSKCKWVIGIPVLSSIQLNVNSTGFSFYDIGKATSQVNLDNLSNKAHRVDFITNEIHLNLLFIGYKWNEYFAVFTATERIETKLMYSGDLINFLSKGNGNNLGEKIKISPLGLNFIHYREYALGLSREVDKNFFIGGKAKLLFGKANVQTRRRTSYFETDADFYTLNIEAENAIDVSLPLGPNNVNADGVPDPKINKNIKPLSYLLNRKNFGFAFDLGTIYPYDDNITISASALDLGLIFWRKDVHRFSQKGQLSYSGPALSDTVTLTNYLNAMGDSVKNQIKVKEELKPYITTLVPKFNIGATYEVLEHVNVGILSHTEFYPRRPYSGISLSANTHGYKYLNLNIAYTIINHSWNSVGFGFTLKLGAFQWHMYTDNLTTFIKPSRARSANIRFGLNLNFGCGKKEKSKKIGKGGCDCDWLYEPARRSKKGNHYK